MGKQLPLYSSTHKTCTKCKLEKPVSEYDRRRILTRLGNKSKAIQSWCKPCVRAYGKSYRFKNPEKIKEKHLRLSYGITKEHYEILYRRQNGLCAICNSIPTIRKDSKYGLHGLHIDHDHKSGKVRGLLCPKCNFYLHRMEEPELLIASLKYLIKHGLEFEFKELSNAASWTS